jgi:hypothetical protein
MEITQEMAADCVSDTSLNGKYYQLYKMFAQEIEKQWSEERISQIKETIIWTGIDCSKMSTAEILFEYSQLL